MSKNGTIDAVRLMRTLRDKLSADMKGMTAQERLEYIRRAARGKRPARPVPRPRRSKSQPVRT
jgi:hypothetical protein